MTTLVGLWTEVRRRLEAAGVELPVFDARLLVEAGAGASRMDILTEPRRELSAAQVAAVDALARRREAREPVSQILGRKQFWSFELAVTRDVLTPRPETELVVSAGLKLLAEAGAPRVLDLGVGSGAILLAVLTERADALGVGVDASEAALAVAQQNAARLGLGARCSWRLGGWEVASGGDFDLVVSNPPYIPRGEIDALAPEVAHYEPRLALDGGPDGLDAYRAIAALLPGLLKPGGGFALEVGAGQAEAVSALAAGAGLAELAIHPDLAGIARVVTGRRVSQP